MSFFRTIVAAVDASPASEYAVGVGISLANLDESNLVFAVAIDPALGSHAGFAAFEDVARQQARELLGDALARAEAAGIAARGEIFVDQAAKGMIDLVRAYNAGVLMVGQTPRQSRFNPFMSGIVEQILRKSTVPLCAVRRPARGYLNHRILVPLADDDLRESAVSYAVELAGAQGSTICFCTVSSSSLKCDKVLTHAQHYAEEHGVTTKTKALTEHANVVAAICDHADLESYDAIVMASHGRDGWPRLISGSVAESVIDNSNVPVIVVRPESER